ncbi:OmpP1/FadL family transporter [Micavibrio aeruginosavorus]|uniref:Outer membrane transport family protein n=1 Tax=Micavibrio aeruginosavorus (strain ARL-13) TaxID=856793 RepID=G2KMI4_MICAA|nr:outer membrane protein transport protein [Micavibrio aeruginosavorus]AEP10677.1 outer membrane transport family protein [Micavibrio aeruginosavorus ARL-13]
MSRTKFSIIRTGLMAAATLIVGASAANAAGFYIQEQSVRGLGSAFSGSTTTLNDASTVYFNPAGMTQLPGLQAQAGVHVIIPDSKVKDTGSTAPLGMTLGGSSGNPYDPTPVPNGFVSYQATDNLWFGIGVTAPFGLASDYGDTWFGRFDSTKTELAVIDVQPTIAYKINEMFSIGAGVNIQHSDADLRNSVNLVGLGLGEGQSKLEGDDFGYGYSLGIQFRPWDHTTFGLSYKSEVHHELDGKIEVKQLSTGNIVASQSSNGSAKLNTPDHLTFGGSHQLNDRLTIQGQATWFGWSNFDAITAVRDSGAVASSVQQNYQNTWAFAVGAEYMVNDAWTVRGGVQFDETPTTDEFRTSRTPDGDRTWISAGATYALNEKIDLDMAGTYIFVEDGTINLQRGAANPTTGAGAGNMRAKTEGSVGILALGMTYKF